MAGDEQLDNVSQHFGGAEVGEDGGVAGNEDRIAAITRKATPNMLWKDAFAQLSNSKVEANFADHRTYTYNGEPIDTAYHLGYDLSVTKHYPVEAANSGHTWAYEQAVASEVRITLLDDDYRDNSGPGSRFCITPKPP